MAHAYKNKKVDFNSTNAVDILAPATNTTAIIKSMLLSDDGGGSNFLMKIVNGADTSYGIAKWRYFKNNSCNC